MDTVKMLQRTIKARPTMDVADAKRAWAEFRKENGWGPNGRLLTPPSDNLKLGKDAAHATHGLALAPSDASGHNVCRYATQECKRGCVAYSGNGLYPKVGQARQLKVRFLHHSPEAFLSVLGHELSQVTGHVRLNTFSDIPWERIAPWLIERGDLYDYTKWPDRVRTDQYDLTFSASENTTDAQIHDTIPYMNVAVVFDTPRGKPLPDEYLEYEVVDGDASDARWLDPLGVIVGLRAKGRMRMYDTNGMVRHANSEGNHQ